MMFAHRVTSCAALSGRTDRYVRCKGTLRNWGMSTAILHTDRVEQIRLVELIVDCQDCQQISAASCPDHKAPHRSSIAHLHDTLERPRPILP